MSSLHVYTLWGKRTHVQILKASGAVLDDSRRLLADTGELRTAVSFDSALAALSWEWTQGLHLLRQMQCQGAKWSWAKDIAIGCYRCFLPFKSSASKDSGHGVQTSELLTTGGYVVVLRAGEGVLVEKKSPGS